MKEVNKKEFDKIIGSVVASCNADATFGRVDYFDKDSVKVASAHINERNRNDITYYIKKENEYEYEQGVLINSNGKIMEVETSATGVSPTPIDDWFNLKDKIEDIMIYGYQENDWNMTVEEFGEELKKEICDIIDKTIENYGE